MEITTKILDRDHQYAVKSFLDYYALRRQSPELDFLKEILHHFSNLPYENISKIIKHHQIAEIRLDKIRLPDQVIHEHMEMHLGGTCFSLTYFLQEILSDCGFICYPVMADMHSGENVHCCLIVILGEKKYLVDPGYLLTTPMEIDPKQPRLYKTESTGVELIYKKSDAKYHLYTFNNMETKWRYKFADRPTPMDEFIQHWLASFTMPTMNGICLTKISKNGYIYIRNNFMREQTLEKKKNYNLKKNYHEMVGKLFGIDKDVIEQAKAALKENLERGKFSS